jgi:ATP-binding cassette subfamily B protein
MGPMRWMAGGMPAEKSLNFKASVRRLFGMMRPERAVIGVVIFLGVSSVTLSVIGPKLLGVATDIIFTGVIGKQLPPGVSKDQVVAGMRAAGNNRMADLVAAMNVVRGRASTCTR